MKIPMESHVFIAFNVLQVLYIHIALKVTTRQKQKMTIITNAVNAALMFISPGLLAFSYSKQMDLMRTINLEQQ